MAAVSMRGIRKSYEGGISVIQGVDLEIEEGEFMVFVGPSGCGKTTIMRMIAGLEEITEGVLRIGTRVANDLPPVQRDVAMVFQSYALYPHMTVAENMSFGLRIAGRPASEVAEKVGRAAEILQITHLLDRKPKALSGGQRQRVAIGRAIVRKPKVFLFDEPLSNLDAGLRVQMRVELTRLHRELGATMVYVTHDQTEAMTMGDRIAVFNHGVVQQVGAPMELYQRPANVFVAQFLGSPRMNVMAAGVSSRGNEAIIRVAGLGETTVWLRSNVGVGPDVTHIGVRPEAVSIGEGSWKLKLSLIERLGDTTLLHGTLPSGDPLVIKSDDNELPWKAGDWVRFQPNAGQIMLFDAGGHRIGII